jgi:hypothetical protein
MSNSGGIGARELFRRAFLTYLPESGIVATAGKPFVDPSHARAVFPNEPIRAPLSSVPVRRRTRGGLKARVVDQAAHTGKSLLPPRTGLMSRKSRIEILMSSEKDPSESAARDETPSLVCETKPKPLRGKHLAWITRANRPGNGNKHLARVGIPPGDKACAPKQPLMTANRRLRNEATLDISLIELEFNQHVPTNPDTRRPARLAFLPTTRHRLGGNPPHDGRPPLAKRSHFGRLIDRT